MANILIIGATSAIATKMAEEYAKSGHSLYCLGRNPEKMKSLANKLGKQVLGFNCFDFTDTEKVQRAIQEAKSVMTPINLAIIAHGGLCSQEASETDYQVVEQTLKVNYLSVVNFLIQLKQLFLAEGSGKIGVITSVAGDRGRPRNYTYGSAKGALSLYMQGLRSQLWSTGIKVYDIKLGPVDTPFTVSHKKNFSFSTADEAAKKIVKALAGKRYTVYVPSWWYWVMWVVRWLPEQIFQRLKFLKD